MARTTPTDVRDELDVSSSGYPDSEAGTDITRANYIVNDRIAGRLDDTPENETLLTDIETLVAAHLATAELSDAVNDGRAVRQVSEGSGQITFADNGTTGPGGYVSSYWNQAITLDPTGRLGIRTRGVNVTATDIEGQ